MAKPLTVYDHISRNNLKTAFLVLMFPVSVSILVWIACYAAVHFISIDIFTMDGVSKWLYWFPDMAGKINESNIYFFAASGYWISYLLLLFTLSFGWMAISYYFGDKMMLGFAGAKPIELKDNKKLYRSVQNVAIAAGLPMPKVYEIDDESMNAFATGHSPKTASIAVTTGLLKKLTPLELEAVIAHEMAHIGNRDVRLNLLIITGISVFGFLAEGIRIHFIGTNQRNEKANPFLILVFFVQIALMIFHYLIAPLLRLAVSRSREYAADATGAKIIHNPGALADALMKISTDARVEILDQQPVMATACIADPSSNGRLALSSLSSTHPPIGERIRRLRAM